jgi:hypothetical protein
MMIICPYFSPSFSIFKAQSTSVFSTGISSKSKEDIITGFALY